MLTEELLELIQFVKSHKTETQTIEVKAAHRGCPQRLYDTLSSFSNQDGGGTMLFGLDETQGFAVVGVYDLQDLQKKVTEQCNYVAPLLETGKLEMTIPGKPRSPKQRFVAR